MKELLLRPYHRLSQGRNFTDSFSHQNSHIECLAIALEKKQCILYMNDRRKLVTQNDLNPQLLNRRRNNPCLEAGRDFI